MGKLRLRGLADSLAPLYYFARGAGEEETPNLDV